MQSMTYRTADEILEYDPKTGNFKWKIDVSNSVKAGSWAGCYRLGGRQVTLQFKGRDYPLAKIAYVLMRREWPERIYYIDGEKHNLRFSNLTDSLPEKKLAKLTSRAQTNKEEKLEDSNIFSENPHNNISTETPYGGLAGLIQENPPGGLHGLIDEKPLEVVKETKSRIEGKARLSLFEDKPELVECICRKCLKTFYKVMINYTRNIPSTEYYCKKCDRKNWDYTFKKVNKILELVQKFDIGGIEK